MNPHAPRLYADPRGVWRDDGVGRIHGVRWNEIDGVDAYAIDADGTRQVFVELGTAAGHRLELPIDWPGYREVATALSLRLAGLRLETLLGAGQLRPEDPPAVLWWRD
ncbi:hypothetical protein [Lysobacter antibioticus]|uniref:hypothetical protein n=1 Tax=Lysobacter antibioticus TaxID=84531 RepID=UPI00034D24B3|nr:hypothetical protein [Lysobacter antibioticus]